MTINYVGNRQYDERLAEFSYKESETVLAERVFGFLTKVKGWDIDTSVAEWAACVVEDRREYEILAKEYKEAKKMIRNCMKYGF